MTSANKPAGGGVAKGQRTGSVQPSPRCRVRALVRGDLARRKGGSSGHRQRERVLAAVRVRVHHRDAVTRRRASHPTLALATRPDGADLDAVRRVVALVLQSRAAAVRSDGAGRTVLCGVPPLSAKNIDREIGRLLSPNPDHAGVASGQLRGTNTALRSPSRQTGAQHTAGNRTAAPPLGSRRRSRWSRRSPRHRSAPCTPCLSDRTGRRPRNCT